MTWVGGCWAVDEPIVPLIGEWSGMTRDDLRELSSLAFYDVPDEPEPEDVGAVRTVPLKGLLMPDMGGFLGFLLGAGGLSSFRQQFTAAVDDAKIKRIVLDIDSPGGMVDMIPETAELIRTAGKPVTAVVNTLAASAAYWLAAGAREIVVTPSGEAGSIGVYSIHRDESEKNQAEGVKYTIVRAGRYKAEGMPMETLTDDAHDHMQEGVDDYYEMFVKAVARGRKAKADDVKRGFGQGRSLPAARALKAGLVDRVATLDTVIEELAGRRSVGRKAAFAGTTTASANPAEVTFEWIEKEPDEAPKEEPVYDADEKQRLLVMADLFGINLREETADAG
jgi:capsid assembly protease